MANSKSGIPISERALIQRLNRKLQAQDQKLKTARGWRMQSHAGRFYVINSRHGWVEAKNIDLEEWGRERGALHPWEQLAD
jgi:hypothetical protein